LLQTFQSETPQASGDGGAEATAAVEDGEGGAVDGAGHHPGSSPALGADGGEGMEEEEEEKDDADADEDDRFDPQRRLDGFDIGSKSSSMTGPVSDTADKILVFALYKKEARDVAKSLVERGFDAAAIQGDMSQNARYGARFRQNFTR
jgi:hypothetical protein